jgi:hypothetical protein
LLVAFSSNAEHISVSGVIANTGGNPVEIYFTDGDTIPLTTVFTGPVGQYNIVVTTDDSSGVLIIFFFDCDSQIVDTIIPYYTGMPPVIFNADFCDSLGTVVCISNFTALFDTGTLTYALLLDSTVQQNAVMYLWDFGNGDTVTEYFPSYTYGDTGAYEVCLTVTEADGQACTGCQLLSIDSAGTSVSVTPFGISGYAAPPRHPRTLSVHPNPVNTYAAVHFEALHPGVVVVSVLNATGAVVKSVSFNAHAGANDFSVDMRDLAKGLYLLQLTDGRRTVAARAVKQ